MCRASIYQRLSESWCLFEVTKILISAGADTSCISYPREKRYLAQAQWNLFVRYFAMGFAYQGSTIFGDGRNGFLL